jgi:putative Mg2+ transporter-C (MgtC) family protein
MVTIEDQPSISGLSCSLNGDKHDAYMASFSWLWKSWWFLAPAPCVALVLALIAVVCGIIVGNERQHREKPAGLRTLTLVCLGSAVFTMMSFAFTSTTGDSGRVAAQIVTGIGFLGAGVILHGRQVISGMTTAALIWMTAAIGMAVGAGYAIPALILSLMVDRLLVGIFMYETQWHPDLRNENVVISFNSRNGLARIRLERALVNYNTTGVVATWSQPAPDIGRLTLRLRLARVHLFELLGELAEVPDVISVEQEVTPLP